MRIVGLLWRLRRAGKLETGVLFWQRLLAEVDLEVVHFVDEAVDVDLRRKAREQAVKTDTTALAFLGEAYIGGENSLAKLSRYESAIQRNLVRTLHELQRLQAARKGEHVPPPVAVDIDVTGLPERVTPSDES